MIANDVSARKDFATDLIRRAGALVVRRADVISVSEKSSPTDIATAVDLASEQLIVSTLLDRFPGDGMYAEEEARIESSTGYTWIIDPLDGTANFVRDLRCSAVSIALAHDDLIVAGLVYDPYGNELFVGVIGEGATRNGALMLPRDHDGDLRRCFIGLSGSNRLQPRATRTDLFDRLVEVTDSVRDPGSTALSLCWTAAGRFDAHIGIDVEWWDLAAGVLIAREAGCSTLAFDGSQDPGPDGFVVAPAPVLQAMRPYLPLPVNAAAAP